MIINWNYFKIKLVWVMDLDLFFVQQTYRNRIISCTISVSSYFTNLRNSIEMSKRFSHDSVTKMQTDEWTYKGCAAVCIFFSISDFFLYTLTYGGSNIYIEMYKYPSKLLSIKVHALFLTKLNADRWTDIYTDELGKQYMHMPLCMKFLRNIPSGLQILK